MRLDITRGGTEGGLGESVSYAVLGRHLCDIKDVTTEMRDEARAGNQTIGASNELLLQIRNALWDVREQNRSILDVLRQLLETNQTLGRIGYALTAQAGAAELAVRADMEERRAGR